MAIKIKLIQGKIIIPLNQPQSKFRIADTHGNHMGSPTRTKKEEGYFVEWMITNDEIELLSKSLLSDSKELIKEMERIEKFAEDSEYSQRKTVKIDKKEVETFEGFRIYQYNESFSSFEKNLDSGLKVRVTFKLGDYGLEPHPHMYVLIPFNHNSLKLKNKEGEVSDGEELGSGCFGELILEEGDLKEIILTLSHASNNHRDALIRILKS